MFRAIKMNIIGLIIIIPMLSVTNRIMAMEMDVAMEIFHEHLSELTNVIIAKYFNEHICITIVTEMRLFHTLTPNSSIAIIRISLETEGNTYDKNMMILLADAISQNCDGYIIQIFNPKCFLNLWLTSLQLTVNRHVPKILFLPASPEYNHYVSDLFSDELSDMTGFIVAAEINFNQTDWPITLWTNDYSLPAGTPGRENIFLDKWTITNGFLYNNQIYYDKILNLNGRAIKLMTFTYPTYTVVENDTLEGTEGRMVMEFCRIHNCTYKVIDDGYFWGAMNDTNGTAKGIIGLVFTRKVDMGFVGLYQWPDVQYNIDYSATWLYGSVGLLVPKPTPLSAWKTPFLPFDFLIWFSSFLTIIFCGIAFYIISTLNLNIYGGLLTIGRIGKFKRIYGTALAVFGVCVLQSPPQYLLPKISSVRIIFISIELLVLIITSCYAAELASYLTVPQYSKPIDTMRELAANNLQWIAIHDAFVYSLLYSEDEIAKKVAKNFKVLPKEISLREAEKGVYGITIERLPGGYITEQLPYINDKILRNSHVMKEYLYGSPCSLMFVKASPFVQHFNNLMNRLLDTGIVLFWEDEVARKYFTIRTQMAYNEAKGINKNPLPKQLTLEHVQGTFFLYFLGLLCATVSFIFEIYLYKRKF